MTAHELIARLNASKIHFTMINVREEAIMFLITVPGERWEVEVFADGHLEIETFGGSSGALDGAKLDDLFERFAD